MRFILLLPLACLCACAGAPTQVTGDIALANATGSICDSNPATATARGTLRYSWDCDSKSLVAMSSLAYTPYFSY
jgi:hypothetical protein